MSVPSPGREVTTRLPLIARTRCLISLGPRSRASKILERHSRIEAHSTAVVGYEQAARRAAVERDGDVDRVGAAVLARVAQGFLDDASEMGADVRFTVEIRARGGQPDVDAGIPSQTLRQLGNL